MLTPARYRNLHVYATKTPLVSFIYAVLSAFWQLCCLRHTVCPKKTQRSLCTCTCIHTHKQNLVILGMCMCASVQDTRPLHDNGLMQDVNGCYRGQWTKRSKPDLHPYITHPHTHTHTKSIRTSSLYVSMSHDAAINVLTSPLVSSGLHLPTQLDNSHLEGA